MKKSVRTINPIEFRFGCPPGSLLYLAEPLGSLSSGWITEQLGRKRAMILVNAPHIAAWILLYFAHSKAHVYVAASLLGLGAGLLGSPVAVYVGEIRYGLITLVDSR